MGKTTCNVSEKAVKNVTETIVATVQSVTLFNEEFGGKLHVVIDKKLKGFVRQDDGTFADGEVDFINLNTKAATAQLCAVNDDIATFRGIKCHAFNQARWSTLLRGATITFNYTLHSAGEVLEGAEDALEHDVYIVDIIKCILTQRSLDLIDKVVMAAMLED